MDFFVLESSEHVEQLDGLLSRAGNGTPDLDAFARHSRAIRGSATMAKITGIADVATGLERVVKGLREGSLHWSELLRGAVIAAVDDLKILIRGARTWGTAEDHRAAERAGELNTLAPAFHRRSAATPLTALGASSGFLAAEATDVAAGLQRYADAPGPITTFEKTLGRVRALRGVAALLDLPPLAEVVATIDETAKSLEISGATPSDTQCNLFRTAAAVLREGAEAVHDGGRPDPDSNAVQEFTAAAAAMAEGIGESDLIVPISALFPDGGGANVLHAAENPPTTAGQRFRRETVSQAEHLRRLVGDGQSAADGPTRQRVGHELRAAVRALGRAAESFGETSVAMTLQALIEGASLLESRALSALDEASRILTAGDAEPLAGRFEALLNPAPRIRVPDVAPDVAPAPEALQRQLAVPAEPDLPAIETFAPDASPVLSAPPVVAPSAPIAPSGTDLHHLLGAGIQGLSGLDREPLSEPVDVDDDGIVPIQDLLYRGRAALHRAVEIGDTLKRAGPSPDAESLAELYDLLELAAAE